MDSSFEEVIAEREKERRRGDKFKRQLDIARGYNADLRTQLADRDKTIAELREALEWYADRVNNTRSGIPVNGIPGVFASKVERDRGKRARAALEKAKRR